MLARSDVDRVAKSFGRNAGRLIKAKRHYDPDNVFRSAIPLPVNQAMAGVSNPRAFERREASATRNR